MPRSVEERRRAQLAYLRSDDRLRERGALAGEETAAERLALAYALGRTAAEIVARLPPETRARLEAARERPTAEAELVLRRLGRTGRPLVGGPRGQRAG